MSDILDECRSRFGISFSEAMTGGGCCALEARLESGHWLVATDEALCGFRERQKYEADPEHPNMGWSIGIYPDAGGDEGWFGVDSIVDVVDIDARAEKLPDMIELALAELAGVAKRNAQKKGMQ
jgi:hypothetical protein